MFFSRSGSKAGSLKSIRPASKKERSAEDDDARSDDHRLDGPGLPQKLGAIRVADRETKETEKETYKV